MNVYELIKLLSDFEPDKQVMIEDTLHGTIGSFNLKTSENGVYFSPDGEWSELVKDEK